MNEYEKVTETQDATSATAKELVNLMQDRGWKVCKRYMAKLGSMYLQFEQVGGEGYISGKVRIANHRQKSDEHVTPEIEILVGEKFGPNDLVGAADAIVAGEQGEF